MKETPAIEFKNVRFSYDKTCILENVNISILQGEFIGIFGPNGGGKTTFLELLAGFLKPQSGKISIFGKTSREARTALSYVPQIARLDKQFPISVEELVQMGCLTHCSILGTLSSAYKQKAHYALEQVGLIDYRKASFGSLSGGQAQRALIARALAADPKVLLLDEPTASVDPKAEIEILQILDTLKGKMTILMVTHDLQTIIQKAERLLCIHRHLHSFSPSAVCEHFGLGLYHTPLLKKTGLPK